MPSLVVTAVLLAFFGAGQLGAAEKALPRVLILGDQIYQQPASDLKKEFKEKAEIHYPRLEPGVVWNSATALELLDRQLGEGSWDLIHFNCGLGDLIHRFPSVKAFRVMPRPCRWHSDLRLSCEKNLHILVTRLKATGAKLVWGSTTPIRHSSTNVFEKGKEIEYNALASKVMAKHGIPTNDMHAFVKGLIDMNKPAGHGADPFSSTAKPIHSPLREILRKDLGVVPVNLPKP